MRKLQYRSIFLSDIHLGTKDAQAEYLLDFLRSTESQYLYLVGDIIDLWKLKSGWYWPQLKNNIVQLVMHKAAHGTTVIYIPGNHDELLRDYVGSFFNGIHIQGEAIHTTVTGKRLLLLHGDEFDSIVVNSKWLAHLGSWAYDWLLWVNRYFNVLRRRLGFPYWSLSAYLKHRVKNAVNFISSFEEALAREASRRRVDGLVCGHIHKASIVELHGVLYINCGDWVESCSAIVEDFSGELNIVRWGQDSVMLLDKQAREEEAVSI